MAEGTEHFSRPADPVGRVLYQVARFIAILGGILLAGIAFLTTISIIGRFVFSSPIPGDFELVAIGTGLSVFAFLPWCQLMRGNVIVDFFMDKAPTRAKALCDVVGGLLYLSIGALLTWRMVFGGIDMYKYNESSMTIGFPRWTTFPISILLMGFLVIVVIYTIWRSIAEARAGRFFDEGSGSMG